MISCSFLLQSFNQFSDQATKNLHTKAITGLIQYTSTGDFTPFTPSGTYSTYDDTGNCVKFEGAPFVSIDAAATLELINISATIVRNVSYDMYLYSSIGNYNFTAYVQYTDGTVTIVDSLVVANTSHIYFSSNAQLNMSKHIDFFTWEVDSGISAFVGTFAMSNFKLHGYKPEISNIEYESNVKVGEIAYFTADLDYIATTLNQTITFQYVSTGNLNEQTLETDWIGDNRYFKQMTFSTKGIYNFIITAQNEWNYTLSSVYTFYVGDYPQSSYLSLFSNLDGFPLESKDFKVYLGTDEEQSIVNFRDYHGSWSQLTMSSTVNASLIDDYIKFSANQNGLKTNLEGAATIDTQTYNTLLFNAKVTNNTKLVVIFNPDVYEKDYYVNFYQNMTDLWYAIEIPFFLFNQYNNATGDLLYQIGFWIQNATIQISNIRAATHYDQTYLQEAVLQLNMSDSVVTNNLDSQNYLNNSILTFNSNQNIFNYSANYTTGFNNSFATFNNISIDSNKTIALEWNNISDVLLNQSYSNVTSLNLTPSTYSFGLDFNTTYYKSMTIENTNNTNYFYVPFQIEFIETGDNCYKTNGDNIALRVFEKNATIDYIELDFTLENEILGGTGNNYIQSVDIWLELSFSPLESKTIILAYNNTEGYDHGFTNITRFGSEITLTNGEKYVYQNSTFVSGNYEFFLYQVYDYASTILYNVPNIPNYTFGLVGNGQRAFTSTYDANVTDGAIMTKVRFGTTDSEFIEFRFFKNGMVIVTINSTRDYYIYNSPISINSNFDAFYNRGYYLTTSWNVQTMFDTSGWTYYTYDNCRGFYLDEDSPLSTQIYFNLYNASDNDMRGTGGDAGYGSDAARRHVANLQDVSSTYFSSTYDLEMAFGFRNTNATDTTSKEGYFIDLYQSYMHKSQVFDISTLSERGVLTYIYNVTENLNFTYYSEDYSVIWNSSNVFHVKTNVSSGLFTLSVYDFNSSSWIQESITDSWSYISLNYDNNSIYDPLSNTLLFNVYGNSSLPFVIQIDSIALETFYNKSNYYESSGYYLSNVVNFNTSVNIVNISVGLTDLVNTSINVSVSDNLTGSFDNWINYLIYNQSNVQFLKFRIDFTTLNESNSSIFHFICFNYTIYTYNLSETVNLTYYTGIYSTIFNSSHFIDIKTNNSAGLYNLSIYRFNETVYLTKNFNSTSYETLNFTFVNNTAFDPDNNNVNLFYIYGNSSCSFEISINLINCTAVFNKTLYFGDYNFTLLEDFENLYVYVKNNNSLSAEINLINSSHVFNSSNVSNSSQWLGFSHEVNSSVLYMQLNYSSFSNSSIYLREIFETKAEIYRLISIENRQNPNNLIFTGPTKTLAILDYFNNTLYRKELDYASFIDVALPFCTLTFHNFYDEFLEINITRGLGTTITLVLPPQSSISIRVYSTSYQVHVRNEELQTLLYTEFSPQSSKQQTFTLGNRQSVDFKVPSLLEMMITFFFGSWYGWILFGLLIFLIAISIYDTINNLRNWRKSRKTMAKIERNQKKQSKKQEKKEELERTKKQLKEITRKKRI